MRCVRHNCCLRTFVGNANKLPANKAFRRHRWGWGGGSEAAEGLVLVLQRYRLLAIGMMVTAVGFREAGHG